TSLSGTDRALDATHPARCIILYYINQSGQQTDMTDNTRPPRRGRRPAPDNERKDRVIQTRVPRDLEDTLRNAAGRQRVSVSHLIRHVLEDTFQLVDNIVADSASLMGNVSRDARRLAATARGQAAAT